MATDQPVFHYVQYAWDDAYADRLDPVDRLVYRSNLLGADQRITNTGGGNTSSKLIETDPLTGEQVEVLWVKGSGGDLRTSKRENFSSLYMDKLLGLQQHYHHAPQRGPKTPIEDEMVDLYRHATFNLNPRPSSIDTPLHGFVPFKHVDHMHPNAVIAIAAAQHSEQLTREIYGDEVVWTAWQRPGFDLGLKLEQICREHPKAKGVIMGRHGLINWADDDKACYELTLDLIERAARFIEAHDKGEQTFGGQKYQALDEARRHAVFAEILPWLRGQVSQSGASSAPSRTTRPSCASSTAHDAPRLAELGTSCPDHFLRTKIKPLYVDWNPQTEDVAALKHKLSAGLEQYRKDYAAYYEQHKHARLAGDARPQPDRHPHPRPGHDRLGQGQERVARDGRVLQLRGRSHARRGGDRRIHRAAAAGSVRHRVLAARRGQAPAHAARKGTGAPGHRGGRRAAAASAARPRIGWRRKARTSCASTATRPRHRPRRKRSPTSTAWASAWPAAASRTAARRSGSPPTSPTARASARCSSRSRWPTAASTRSSSPPASLSRPTPPGTSPTTSGR